MKKLVVMNTFEGNTKDLVDLELQGGEIVCGVPFFNKDGDTINYDEALELYGFDGLADDIWSDEAYLTHIARWIEENE